MLTQREQSVLSLQLFHKSKIIPPQPQRVFLKENLKGTGNPQRSKERQGKNHNGKWVPMPKRGGRQGFLELQLRLLDKTWLLKGYTLRNTQPWNFPTLIKGTDKKICQLRPWRGVKNRKLSWEPINTNRSYADLDFQLAPLLWAELCSTDTHPHRQFVCWSPNRRYLEIWLYLETGLYKGD